MKVRAAEDLSTALYCRLSVDDGEEGDSNSIVNQKKMLGDYAESHGYLNPKFYTDDGYSGTNFNRPGFQELIRDVDAGRVGTIIVKDMSRLGRDYLKVGYYSEVYFGEAGVHFIAVNDGVDNMVENDSDFTPFRNIMNEWYAKDTSKKVKAVLRAKGKSGKSLTNCPPYGYTKDGDGNWHIEEEAAGIIRSIYSMCVEGYGPSQIARKLNETGAISPIVWKHKVGWKYKLEKVDHPEIWTVTAVRRILSNPVYLGHTINFRTKKKSYKSHSVVFLPKEDWVVFENTHEPIIDKDTFDTVQKLREGIKRRLSIDGEMSVFSGLLYCADCGNKMYLNRHRGKEKDCFNCASYVQAFGKDVAMSEDEQIKTMQYALLHKDFNTRKVMFKTKADVYAYGKKALDNYAKYGAKDWYDWRREHWGTKWNACRTQINDLDKPEIYFDTAWSAPLPVLDKLSQMYPDLKFDFEFADEDIGRNAGDMLIQNGEILKGGFLDDCKEACETYFRLWGGETDYRFNENTGTYEYIDEEVM